MCGIAGYINPSGVDETLIKKMTDSIRHRGPDGHGIYIDHKRNVGLGHRRLSIIDLEGGKQPMASPDNNYWIVFNGEIYNYKSLRKKLEKDYYFKTNSDTEVLLALYQKYQDQCLYYIRGMFAFAIFDRIRNRLFLARDHLGQKPLYYFHKGKVFGFASEIKALLAAEPSLAKMNTKALYEYFCLRIITPTRSMFQQIEKLPPGHCAIFQNGWFDLHCYWKLNYKNKFKADINEIEEHLDEKLTDTISHHLVSDVPVGAFLSGGLDSSLVVAKMSELLDKPVETFTGDVPYGEFSEASSAQLVADRYLTKHHVLTIWPSLIRLMPDLVWQLDEPSDSLSVCQYLLSEKIKNHVKVILGGDGGDELFGGYDRYYGNVYADLYGLLPKVIRNKVLSKAISMLPESAWYKGLKNKLKWINEMSFCCGGERYARSLSFFYFLVGRDEQLYTEKFRKEADMFDPYAAIKNYYESDQADDIIDRMLYSDCNLRMPDHPNMILDRMTMAHGIEARSPFLDHVLAEFCAAIPSKFKVKGLKLRILEKKLAKSYLPKDLFKKQKQGFASAMPYILSEEYKMLYDFFLSDSHLAADGYLNGDYIRDLVKQHFSRKQDNGNRLWLLCNAEVWYRLHIERVDRNSLTQEIKEKSDPELQKLQYVI